MHTGCIFPSAISFKRNICLKSVCSAIKTSSKVTFISLANSLNSTILTIRNVRTVTSSGRENRSNNCELSLISCSIPNRLKNNLFSSSFTSYGLLTEMLPTESIT